MADDQPTLALSFDNLGEAADLERGLWPAGRPLGRHPSVTTVLPRLLDELDAFGLRATFCVEGLNCELYPTAIAGIAARGHELALHGWRHEAWHELGAEREDELLARGRRAFAALGVDVRGFRPPGGELTERGVAALAAAGFAWVSPVGERPEPSASPARVPFAWTHVDALYRLPSFAARREALGGARSPLTPAATADRLLAALRGALSEAGSATLVLHPFLMESEAGSDAARRVLRGVRTLAGDGVTVGTVAAVADALLQRSAGARTKS
jgi:peptidoglycan/xylan/chitin deacetylase (PgdA/CDA1 family)